MQQSCLLRAESDPETNKKKNTQVQHWTNYSHNKKIMAKRKENKQNKTKNPKHSVSWNIYRCYKQLSYSKGHHFSFSRFLNMA